MARTHVQQSQISGSLSFNDSLSAGESLAYQPTLVDDLNAMRSQINKIIGKTNWYEALDGSQDLADIHAAVQVSGADTTLQGQLTVPSGSTFNGLADFNASVTANEIKIDSDVVGHMYLVGASGEIQDSADLRYESSTLFVTGAVEVSNGISVLAGGLSVAGSSMEITGTFGVLGDSTLDGALTVTGATTLGGILDVNNTISASAVKIDSDVPKRLYIVDEDGSIKDEANLWFDQTTLFVTGSAELSADLEVKGGDITLSNGVSMASSAANKLVVTASDVVELSGDLKVGGDTIKSSTADAIQLSGSDVEVKGDLQVTGNDIKSSTGEVVVSLAGKDAFFQNDVFVYGDLHVTGTMTYIDTVNLKVKDALIHIATGSNSAASRGIVLHGGSGLGGDLAVGAKATGFDFIFAKNVDDSDVDAGNSEIFSAADLAGAWMSLAKFGDKEGNLSGSLGLDGSDIKMLATNDLLLAANSQDPISFIESGEKAAFDAQFGSVSLVGALLAASTGGNFKQDSFKPGVTSAGASINFSSVASLRSASVADDASKKVAMDVYLNGVRLAYTDDYAVTSTTTITLAMDTIADDVLTVVIHNAAL